MIVSSYAGKPVDFIIDTTLIAPSTVRHSLNEPTTRFLPERWISILVTSVGSIILLPAIREPSSICGATFCGGDGGGGGGGGGAPSAPLMSPPTTPPSTPPSSPPSTPATSVDSCLTSCFSIFTGWTMSFTVR